MNQTAANETIVEEITIKGSAERIFEALADHGEYTRIDRPRLLEFTWNPSWQGDNLESLVRFDMDEKEGITTVRVTHSGLSPAARDAHKGWPQILSWLKTYVE